ncbi:MAG: ATP-binding protein, partial [Candidatus Dormibacteraceae bacterium]
VGEGARSPRDKQPIFEDVFLAANAGLETSRKSAMLITGETGGGKTNAAAKTAVEAALRGATVLMLDPKHDLDGLENLGLTNFQRLELTPDHAGLLNPFGSVHSDRPRQGLLAAEVCQRMLNQDLLVRGGYLIESAAMAEARQPQPTMPGLIERIRQGASDAVGEQVAANLEAIADMPQGALLFAEPTAGRRLDIEGKLTLVQLADIQLPEPGATRLTLRQRLTLGLMTALTALCGDLIEFGADWIPKLLVIDEAHLLLGSSELETVIERFSRLGRSKFAVVMLVTQSMRDV